MGFSKTPSEFVSKLSRSVEAGTTGNRAAIFDMSRTAERVMDGSVAAMTGGRMIARNAPNERRPQRMRARSGVLAGDVKASAIVGPKGPVPLLENGSPPHPIGEGRASKSGGWTGSGSEILTIPNEDVVRWGPFVHPGTAGKHRWIEARATLPKVIAPTYFAAQSRNFLGPFL